MITEYTKLVLKALDDYENWHCSPVHTFDYKPNDPMCTEISLSTHDYVFALSEKVREYNFNLYERFVIWNKIKAVKAKQLSAIVNPV